MRSQSKRLGKRLAYLLRHHPESLGLDFDRDGGWVSTKDLVDGLGISIQELKQIIAEDKKKRFSFEDDSCRRIRANYGHSIDVKLGLKQVSPPNILYHGTAQRFADTIMSKGISKMGRQYVHLSVDIDSARDVGKRHGKPVVFKINSRKMSEEGFPFFISESGLYLTEYVPPMYVTQLV